MIRIGMIAGLLAALAASCIREPEPLLIDTPAGYEALMQQQNAQTITEGHDRA